MKHTIITLSTCAVLLTGCFEERKNPLLEAAPQDIVLWFTKIATDKMNACTPFWADPSKAPTFGIEDCKSEKARVLTALNQNNFIEGEFILEDLDSQTPWLRYNEVMQDKKSLERARQPLPKKKKRSKFNADGSRKNLNELYQ